MNDGGRKGPTGDLSRKGSGDSGHCDWAQDRGQSTCKPLNNQSDQQEKEWKPEQSQ